MSIPNSVETPTRWIGRRQVQALLKAAGMPSSRPSLERFLNDEAADFPPPRRITETSVRLWNETRVLEWIARSRCSDDRAGQAVNA